MKISTGFQPLGLSASLLKKLSQDGITLPTAIQKEAIPLILNGRDVIGESPTGTGKTLAYLLPLLVNMEYASKNLQALVLTPTRELAMQVTKVAQNMGGESLTCVALLGGANLSRQVESLKKKPQLVVGTPGRILELIKMRKINGQTIKTIVIDEADKMLTQGFQSDILAIIKATLKDKQLLFFSATISNEVLGLASKLMQNPAYINTTGTGKIAPGIEHIYFSAEENKKAITLQRLIRIYQPNKSIVFITNNQGVGPLTRRLVELGLMAEGLHSHLPEVERKNVLESFRQGKSKVLVTTDLFSRGMDVEGVDFIFNFDLPENEEYYLHRVGRTGRAGNKGTAISLVTEKQKFIIAKYERKLRIKIHHYGIDEEHDKVFPIIYKLKNKRQLRKK